MKKTLTINLSGIVFHIDEDAYLVLQNYLLEVGKYFKSEEDKEILRDIEARIAELFNERLREDQSTVVEFSDVQYVINIMGHPNQFSDEEDVEEKSFDSTKQEDSNTDKKFETNRRKRFYRDPENGIVGGVAAGLAAYLDWDVTLVRILLIILTFFTSGFPFVAYIIIWMITPEAVTAAQKLDMQGKDATIENIKAYMESNEFKERTEQIGGKFIEFGRILFKGIFLVVSVIAALIGVAIIIALLFVIVVLIVGAQDMFLFGDMDPAITSTYGSITVILALVVVLLPIIALVVMATRLIRSQKKAKSSLWGWTLLILWLLSLMGLIGCLIHIEHTEWIGHKNIKIDYCFDKEDIKDSDQIQLEIGQDSILTIEIGDEDKDIEQIRVSKSARKSDLEVSSEVDYD